METKDAMVDGWTMLSNMSLITESFKTQNTHMLEYKEHAKLIREHGKLNHSLMYLQETVTI